MKISKTIKTVPFVSPLVITFTILDDSIPEGNEELTVMLNNPQGGATIGENHSMRVIILANDYVAGRLLFEQTSELVNEGKKKVFTSKIHKKRVSALAFNYLS